ncbi:hypothetical protein D6764_00620 [Candidatus Woesearchaeota archaeon]|nr:MAG: hypothetical protein D6764_00620 [Candidatus Woesearchaeota archaeon]
MDDDKLYRFIKEKSKLVPVAIIRNSLIRHGYPRSAVDEAVKRVLLEKREERWLEEKEDVFRDFSSGQDEQDAPRKLAATKPSTSDDFVPISELQKSAALKESSTHNSNIHSDVLSELKEISKKDQHEEKKSRKVIRLPEKKPSDEEDSSYPLITSLKERLRGFSLFSRSPRESPDMLGRNSSDSSVSPPSDAEPVKLPPVRHNQFPGSSAAGTDSSSKAPNAASSDAREDEGDSRKETAESISPDSAGASPEPSDSEDYDAHLKTERVRFKLNIPLKLLLKAEFREAYLSLKRIASEIDPIRFTYFLLASFSGISVLLLVIFARTRYFETLTKFVLSAITVICLAYAFLFLEKKYSLRHSDRFAFELSTTLGLASWLISSFASPLFMFLIVFPGFLPVAHFIRKLYNADKKLSVRIALIITAVAFVSFYITGLILGIIIAVRGLVL